MMSSFSDIQQVHSIVPSQPDHIFISAASPEKRCLGTIHKLSDSYSVTQSIIIQYDHQCERREQNILQMEELLSKHGPVNKILINETAVLPKLNELVLNISSFVLKQETPRITIDISTMIKWHLLLLLKALARHGLLSFVRILYTEPEEYIITEPLSLYVREIFPVPLFQGHFNFSQNTLLIIILGYEGDRALALFENIDPDECLLLIPRPAYKPQWEGRNEELNKQLINLVGRHKVEYLESRHPDTIKEQLEEILISDQYFSYNHFIAPLGTKPQVLGLFNYFQEHQNKTNIIYISPIRHSDRYSEEIGKTWILQETKQK